MTKNKVESYNELKEKICDKKRSFLMLYKSGSEKSECALQNLLDGANENRDIYIADVSEVRDIHDNYGITSVPTLIEFKSGQTGQIIKGCHDASFYKSIIEQSLYSATQKTEEKKAKRVIVYTTPTCPHCTTLKNYLKDHKIQFRDINVAQDQKMAEAMVKKSGQQGVPQIEINGRIIVGFNKPKIDEILELK